LASQWLVERDRIDGVVAIGCVIRGETAHFDHVCSATAQGIADVNLKTGKPVMFCVLTDDNEAQSAARSVGSTATKEWKQPSACSRCSLCAPSFDFLPPLN
jgi:6,7-dimethyl-8-ribityllumazine synthase